MFDDIKLSPEAIEKFKEGARQYARLEFTIKDPADNSSLSITLTEKNVTLNGLSIELASITGNEFELGTMCAGEVRMELLRDSTVKVIEGGVSSEVTLDYFIFDGATVKVSIGVMLDNGEYEYVGFGVYKLDDAKKTKYNITLVGLDNMMEFMEPCGSGTTPDGEPTFILHEGMTIAESITAICDYCGVSYEDTELGNLTNAKEKLEAIPDDLGKMTCRQVLSQLITLTGCCGRMDANGKFRVTPYMYEDTTISKAVRYEPEISEKAVVLSGVRLINANGNAHLSGEEGYVLELPQNDFVVSNTVKIADNIWRLLSIPLNRAYLPYLVTTVSLPHLRPLNRIRITDTDDEDCLTIITNYLFRLNNSTKIQAKGIGNVRKGYGKPNEFTRNQSRIIMQTASSVNTQSNVAVRSLEQFNETITASMGLYRTEKDGKWYFHDNQSLATSKKVFTMVSDGIAWTDDYKGDDTIWAHGVKATGEAFFRNLLTGGIVVGDKNTNYNVRITPDQFAINENNVGTVTRINKGLMTIPRLEVETHLDFGALRVVPNRDGIDIIYTK